MSDDADTKPVKKDWEGKIEYEWKLPFPIKDASGAVHETFKLREPTVDHFERVGEMKKATKLDQTKHLVSFASGKSIEVIRQLPMSVFSDMADYISHF